MQSFAPEQLEDRTVVTGCRDLIYPPACIMGFIGAFIAFVYGGSLLYWNNEIELPDEILRHLILTLAAGIVWCFAAIAWWKRKWRFAMAFTILGMILFMSGLPDR